MPIIQGKTVFRLALALWLVVTFVVLASMYQQHLIKSIDRIHTAESASPKGLLLSFTVLLGWAALLRKIWRGHITWPESLALACLFFTLLVLPSRLFFLSAEPAFGGAIILALVGWAMLIANTFLQHIQEKEAAAPPAEGVLALLLIALIATALLLSFLMAVLVVPDDWDAWVIWEGKAKMLALGQGPLEDVTRFGHAEYPLLWPTIWAFSGWFSGGWEEYWSKGWGTLFLLLCVWEMLLVVRKESGSHSAGLLAAALFVSIPNVPLITSWASAEAPLWLMMTCGLACLLRWRSEGKGKDAVLAGLFAAAAAYTKNEGLLFALLLGLFFLLSIRHQYKAFFLYLFAFTLCSLPWFWYLRLHLDLGTTFAFHLDINKLAWAIERIIPATTAICAMWLDLRQWNIVGLLVLLAVFMPQVHRYLLLLPLGLLLGYFVIILFNSNEINWQIGTAWNRLTVQILPLLLILLVINCKTIAAQNRLQG